MTAEPRGLARSAIRGIDWLLRRSSRCEEYSTHPDCLLRVSPVTSDTDIELSDGTLIHKGDPLLELHLWNERLISHVLPLEDLALGRAILRYLRASLRLLNEWVTSHPMEGDYRGVRAEFGMFVDLRQAEAILGRLGFDVVLKERPGFRFWRRAFWDNLFSMALMWTFNPRFAYTRRLHELTRGRAWMSLHELQRRFPT
jgi:hypothetical protein